VVRYDLRGFGRSALPDGAEYSRTDDLRALLEYFGIARAHVVGLSMGGAAAIDFALAHPEMTQTLTTADAALSGYRMSAQWEALRGHVVAADDVAEIKARWLALPLFAPANEHPALAARLAQMVADYSGIHWTRSDGHRRARALDELERLRVPVLAVVGERDLPDFHVIADLMAARAGARKAVLAGAGHMSPMENPAAFNRIVLEFLAAHRGGG
jgi:pimeloyl-ACP methyl ester carboxylesterase